MTLEAEKEKGRIIVVAPISIGGGAPISLATLRLSTGYSTDL
jgi:hypothetical protein